LFVFVWNPLSLDGIMRKVQAATVLQPQSSTFMESLIAMTALFCALVTGAVFGAGGLYLAMTKGMI
jgi:hypothetical protein